VDLKIDMTFPTGSTFVFGSWVCTVGDSGKLHNRLVETDVDQAPLALRQDTLEDLVKNFDGFLISSLTRMWKQLKSFESKFSMLALKPSENYGPSLARFPLGLKNTASVYQTAVSRLMPSTPIMEEEEEVPPIGSQQVLVLIAMSEGRIIHRQGVHLLGNPSNSSRVVGMIGSLPHKVRDTLSAIVEAMTTELCTDPSKVSCSHSRDVLYIPDINEEHKEEANHTPEQERLKVMLETTAVMMHERQASSHP
jgi:hypothetical protein